MVCVDESNKEIKKRNWGYIGFEFLLPLHFFKSEVWELIKFQSSQPEYFLPSHLAPTYSLALRSECLQHPTPKSGLHTPPPPPPPTDDLRLLCKDGYTKSAVSFDVHIMSLPRQEPSSYSLRFVYDTSQLRQSWIRPWPLQIYQVEMAVLIIGKTECLW